MTSDGVATALQYLRSAIVAGQFNPGEKLNQASIAATLNMSRIPVREALGILAAEGAVTYEKNRGYTVPKTTVAILDQIYRMRELLETDLIRQARMPTADEQAALLEINDRMRRSAETQDLATFVRLNRAFHFQVFELAQAPVIVQVVDRLWSQSEAFRAMYLYEGRNAERSSGEHVELLTALTEGDIERSIAISDRHRLSVQKHVRDILSTRSAIITAALAGVTAP